MNGKSKPDIPFTTDGCSGGMTWAWRTLLRRPPPWEGLCVAHDRAYWRGGTQRDRILADRALLVGVIECGYPLTGFAMYWAVRFFGSPWWRFSWRWAYGYRHPGQHYYSHD